MKIGIQGIKASFHDVAARKFFHNEEVTPVECATFKSLCLTLQNNEAQYCMMAIENSIAGSILTNYTFLETYNFKIIGEVYLRIKMNLMALPGQKMKDISIIQSHPMALLQCQEFLTDNPEMPKMKMIESSDTAESAKLIAEKKLFAHGAIASEMAAATYQLEILKSGIETNQQNYTRFLIISRNENKRLSALANKASICFEIPHQTGSLAPILGIFNQFDVNMTKIQSVPILGKPYHYSFHVDLEWSKHEQFEKAMGVITSKVDRLICFGKYPCGEKPGL